MAGRSVKSAMDWKLTTRTRHGKPARKRLIPKSLA